MAPSPHPSRAVAARVNAPASPQSTRGGNRSGSAAPSNVAARGPLNLPRTAHAAADAVAPAVVRRARGCAAGPRVRTLPARAHPARGCAPGGGTGVRGGDGCGGNDLGLLCPPPWPRTVHAAADAVAPAVARQARGCTGAYGEGDGEGGGSAGCASTVVGQVLGRGVFELCVLGGLRMPGDDALGEHVEDERDIHPACPRADVDIPRESRVKQLPAADPSRR